MNRIGAWLLIGILGSAMSLAQNSAQTSGSTSQSGTVSINQLGAQAKSGTSASAQAGTAGPGSISIQAGSIIYAELDKSVDAKKTKVGDPVVAKLEQAVLSRGKIVAPKGSKIMGHVTQVQARTKQQGESQLGMVFDHIVLKNGSQIPVSLSIQAIGNGRAPAGLMQDPNNDPTMAGPMSNAGLPGHPGPPSVLSGAAGTAGDITSAAGTAAGDAVGAATDAARVNSSTHVSASSHGVLGMPDVTMATQVRGSTQSTLLTSSKKNIKLDSGAELVLRAQ